MTRGSMIMLLILGTVLGVIAILKFGQIVTPANSTTANNARILTTYLQTNYNFKERFESVGASYLDLKWDAGARGIGIYIYLDKAAPLPADLVYEISKARSQLQIHDVIDIVLYKGTIFSKERPEIILKKKL